MFDATKKLEPTEKVVVPTITFEDAIDARIEEIKAEKAKADKMFNDAINALKVSKFNFIKSQTITLDINAKYNTSINTFYDKNNVVIK